MTFVLAIIAGILLLGFLVFVHEAGHFFVAKFFKVRVEEFGFGFPPRLWGRKKGETIYSINVIPAGGFVRLFGEDGEEKTDPRSFASRGPWTRAAIIVAGVVVNLVVAFLLFTMILASTGFRSDQPTSIPTSGRDIRVNFPFGEQTDSILISFVDNDSAAEKGGLKALDEIVTVEGQTFTEINQFRNYLSENQGRELTFEVFNIFEKTSRTMEVTPRVNPPEGEGFLGVALDRVAIIRYESTAEKVFVGPLHSVNMLYFQAKAMGSLFSQAVEEKSADAIGRNVSGPIGIVTLLGAFIGKTGVSGLFAILETVALLSLILAFMNVLPIPALDGGRLFFTLIEGVTGIKVSQGFERLVHTIGFAVLILLFIVITFNDVLKLFG